MRTRRLVQLLAAAAVAACASAPATAAESYDNCTGTISSLPATISSPGVWCLKSDLATAITSGSAITIAANNVTIDCNDFRIGGLAAGPATLATGVDIPTRLNAIVRHCNIRGFRAGVVASEGGGHLIEGNRITGSRVVGIESQSTDSIVAHNVISDTGGTTAYGIPKNTFGIYVVGSTDVIENLVSGLAAGSNGGSITGIHSQGNDGATISGNRIRGMQQFEGHQAFGIFDLSNGTVFIERNFMLGPGPGATGILCYYPSSAAIRNGVGGFGTTILGCQEFDNASLAAPP